MKNLILLTGILAGFTCSAQQPVATLESAASNILFRGYQNKVVPKVENSNGKEIRLIGTNVDLIQDENSNHYTALTRNEKDLATLHVLLVDGAKVDTVKSVNYKIQNLPVPQFYWGNVASGGTSSVQSSTLSLKYPTGIALPNEFKILSWETSFNGQAIKGSSNDLSSAKSFLETIPSGTTLVFKIAVTSADGITRFRNESWTIGS